MKKSLLALTLVAFAIIILIITRDRTWSIDPPLETTKGQESFSIEDTQVIIPIETGVSQIAQKVNLAIGSGPMFSGETPKLDVDLFIEESFPELFEDVLVSPFKPATCVTESIAKTCFRKQSRRILEECGNPLKWFDCHRTIFFDAPYACTEDVVKCTKEVAAVYESRLKAAAYVANKITPHSLKLKYKGWIQDISIVAQGQEFIVSAKIKADVSADIQAGVLTANQTIKGALKCSSRFELNARAKHQINDGLKIELVVDEFEFDTDQLCVPGAMEIKALTELNPVTFIKNELLHRALEKALKDVLNDVIQDELMPDLDFSEKLQEVSSVLGNPINIDDGYWLTMNPKEIYLTQIVGTMRGAENVLQITAGLVAKPVLSVGESPKNTSGVELLPIVVVPTLEGKIRLAPKGSVDLKYASKELTRIVHAFVKKNHPKQPFSVGKVSIFQSGEKFFISLEIVKRKNDKHLGNLYLTAIPEFDGSTGTIFLRDVEFDADSKNILVKSANWILSSIISQEIEKLAKFNVTGEIADLKKKYSSHTEKLKFGDLEIDIAELMIKDIWVEDGAMHVAAEASGKAQLRFTPK